MIANSVELQDVKFLRQAFHATFPPTAGTKLNRIWKEKLQIKNQNCKYGLT